MYSWKRNNILRCILVIGEISQGPAHRAVQRLEVSDKSAFEMEEGLSGVNTEIPTVCNVLGEGLAPCT